MDELEATPLPGLGSNPRGPFVSPDGNWVGYFDSGILKKVSILGGPPVTVCDVLDGAPRGASWGEGDTIVFATNASSGLWRVPAGGGEPEELTTPDAGQGNHVFPEILPGGEAVLFTIRNGPVETAQIAVLSLVTGNIEVLVPGGSNPRYAPTGHIVYGVDGTLRAVGFDVNRLEVTSDPIPVLEGVVVKGSGATNFGFSLDGSLVYGTGSGIPVSTIVWVDRQGREEPFIDEPGDYLDVRISPDSSKVAVDMRPTAAMGRTIWIYEAGGSGRRTRLAADGGLHSVWTPDGTRITFQVSGSGLHWIPTDGSGEAEALFAGENGGGRPDAWSPDGQFLAFSANGSGSGRDIWILPKDGEPYLFLATPFSEDGPMFSPDGRWLAYTSDESGQPEVYVQPFPGPGRKYPVSTGGGRAPVWSPKGDELFYRGLDHDEMMVVAVELEPEFRAGEPKVLFEQRYFSVGPNNGDAHYDVSSDAQRFLMIKEDDAAGDEPTSRAELIVVLNWFEELKRLVPTN